MKKILIINGPNLNSLGIRQKEIYGSENLNEINDYIYKQSIKMNLSISFYQNNVEGFIIDKLYEEADNTDGFIINLGALSHYSYAIFDAIMAINKPFIEVHMSNIFKRTESFRHKSVISPACIGHISGFGKNSYVLALEAFKSMFSEVWNGFKFQKKWNTRMW